MTWWRDSLIQTFTYQQISGFGDDGGPAYGAKATAACRHERVTDVVRGVNDEEEIVTDRFSTEVELVTGDRVWRPGADDTDVSLSLTVKQVERSPDAVDASAVLTEARCG